MNKMLSVFSKKNPSVQRIADHSATAVFDNSAQNDALQRKVDLTNDAAQRAEAPRPNNTGMPDNLKVGIESLSGFSMDDVRVHYNSSKPATVQALAYTQGTDIHVAPGQEKYLPHEAWHVAQQMAGRVSPTTNINGMPVNDNAALEHEADVMGEKAVKQRMENVGNGNRKATCKNNQVSQMLRVINAYEFFHGIPKDEVKRNGASYLGGNTESLRKKYKQKGYQALADYKRSNTQENIDKLRNFAPTTADCGDEKIIEKEINERIEKNDDVFYDYLILNPNFVCKHENIVINGHGSGVSPIFADMSPKDLAKKILLLLPDGYCGEIYIAGCSTGKRNGDKENTSFIELFKDALMTEAQNEGMNINPSFKGNVNTAISMDYGVCVRDESFVNKDVWVCNVKLYCNDGRGNEFIFFTPNNKSVKCKMDKPKFDDGFFGELKKEIGKRIDPAGVEFYDDYTLQINYKCIQPEYYAFTFGVLDLYDDKEKKWHAARLEKNGLFVSGKKTKLHIPNNIKK